MPAKIPVPSGTPGNPVASVDNIVNPTTLTPPMPIGHALGDTLLCYTSCASPTPTVATPSGWTSVLNVTGTYGRLALFARKVVTGTEPSPDVVWSGLTPTTAGTPVQARIAAFSNLDADNLASLVDVISTVGDTAPSTTLSSGGGAVTTVADNDLVLSLTTRQDDAFTTFTPPAGFSNVTAPFATTSGTDMTMGWAYQVKGNPGSVAVGNYAVTGGQSVGASGVAVALKGLPIPFTSGNYKDLIINTVGVSSYYRLNEGAGNILNELAPGTAPGTVAGGFTRQVAGLITGDPDFAIRGDGVIGTWITVPGGIRTGPTFSWECWVKPESNASRTLMIRGSIFVSISTNNTYRASVRDSTTADWVATSPNNAVKVGQRQHVVLTYTTGAQGMKLYVDGVLVATASPTQAAESVSSAFNIFAASAAGNSFQGTIDEIAAYSRVLTAQEITDHYNMGAAVSVNDTPTGILALSGTCIDSWQTTSASHAPSGRLIFSGTCVDSYLAGNKFIDAPTGRITLFGTAVRSGGDASWGWGIREFPPLRHHIDATAPNGRHYRWAGDEPKAENVFSGLRWGSTMPGGYETGDCVLPRKPGVDYADLERLTTFKVIGPGGKVVGEYRLERTPQTSGDQMAITPSAVGWQAHLDDNKGVSIVFIDREQNGWTGANSQRQLDLLNASIDPLDPSSTQGDDGLPSLKLALEGAWSRRANCEAYYFMPSGDVASRVKFDYQAAASMNIAGDANWVGDLYALMRDGFSGFTQMTPTDWLAAASGSVNADASAFALANRRALMIRLFYNAAGGSDNVQYDVFLRNLRVFGNHGLPLYGVGAQKEGFLASDMIAHALRQWAPMIKVAPLAKQLGEGQPRQPEFTEWIQPTSFVIPQAKFIDTTTGEIVKQLTRFGLEDWAVWNDKIFYLNPRNGNPIARKWRARIGPAKLEETGKQVDRLWESIIVEFQDVDGSSRTVGPPGSGADIESSYLKDTDPDNPANKLGIVRRDKLVMGTSTYEGAVEIGRRFLAEQKLIDRSGRATLVGFVEDNHGVMWPFSEVQAGDVITFVDAADTSYRRIVKADHDDAAKSVSIDLDAPPEGLQAVLERLAVVLVPLGL